MSSKTNEIAVNKDFEEDLTILFEEGLFGFEDHKRFLPVAADESSDAVITLHSLDEEGLAFIIMNPFLLMEDYDPVVPQSDLECLGEIRSEADYSWYVLCVAQKPVSQSTVNLRCPVVINTVTRKAKQVILDNREYGFRHRLGELTRKENKIC